MTHHVHSVLYVPDINHLVPVGSSGQQFSHRTSITSRNSSDIPPWTMSSVGSSAVTPPQHVRSERANWWDQKQRDFPAEQGVQIRSEERKGENIALTE